MLFLYFIAAMNDSPGWMLGLALWGMVFSERPTRYFMLPLLAALCHSPQMGVLITLATWAYLFWKSCEEGAAWARANSRASALDGAPLEEPCKPDA